MKKLLTTVSTTIRAFKLLSNPVIIDRLYQELEKKAPKTPPSLKLGAKDIFFHKHFMVQVVN